MVVVVLVQGQGQGGLLALGWKAINKKYVRPSLYIGCR